MFDEFNMAVRARTGIICSERAFIG